MISLRTTTVLATSGLALTLAACTSATYTCKDNVCNISLSGKNAETTIGESGSKVTLISADGTTAKVKIANQETELEKGQSISFDDARFTVTKVEKDKADLRLDIIEASEESDAAAEEDAAAADEAAAEEGTEEAPAEESTDEAAN